MVAPVTVDLSIDAHSGLDGLAIGCMYVLPRGYRRPIRE